MYKGVARIATLEGPISYKGANNQFLSQNRLIFQIFHYFFDFINGRLVFIGALGGPGPCPPPLAPPLYVFIKNNLILVVRDGNTSWLTPKNIYSSKLQLSS
jgi:hypothetical protein